MDTPVTAALAIAAIVSAVFCGWRGSRLWDFRKGPRMIPWRFLMLLSAVFAMVMIVHLLNLLGVQTGQNQPRFGPLPPSR